MSLSIAKIISIVGFVSLFHAAFSAAQHRSFVRLTSGAWSGVPADVALQAVCALAMAAAGALAAAGRLRETRAEAAHARRTHEALHNLPAFYRHNHRAPLYTLALTN